MDHYVVVQVAACTILRSLVEEKWRAEGCGGHATVHWSGPTVWWYRRTGGKSAKNLSVRGDDLKRQIVALMQVKWVTGTVGSYSPRLHTFYEVEGVTAVVPCSGGL